jgi:hypothetical protein
VAWTRVDKARANLLGPQALYIPRAQKCLGAIQRCICLFGIVPLLPCMVELGNQCASLPRLNLDPSRQLRHCAAALTDIHWSDSVHDWDDRKAVHGPWRSLISSTSPLGRGVTFIAKYRGHMRPLSSNIQITVTKVEDPRIYLILRSWFRSCSLLNSARLCGVVEPSSATMIQAPYSMQQVIMIIRDKIQVSLLGKPNGLLCEAYLRHGRSQSVELAMRCEVGTILRGG